MYPKDWPKCPACDAPALDGHITCGKLECDERAARIIREKYGPPKVHILSGGYAICGKPGVPGGWRDGHRWVRSEAHADSTCAECLTTWQRHEQRSAGEPGEPGACDGTFSDDLPNERKDERPAGRVDVDFDVKLEPMLRAHAAELLRALFAWRDQASSITRWTTKPSRKLAHLADQMVRLFPDATAELRRAGRFDAIEASMKRIQDLATPKGRARELLRIREELATMGNDVEAIAEHAADAAEDDETDERQRRRDAMAGMKAGGIPADKLEEAVDAFVRLSPEHAVAAEVFKAGVQRDERPEGRKDEGTERRGGPVLAFGGGSQSLSFTPIGGGVGIIWRGRPKTICITHEEAGLLSTWLGARGYMPRPPDPIFGPATLHQAGDFLLARFLLANPKKLPSTTTVLELMEWSNAQQPTPLPIAATPLPRTLPLLRRLFAKWKESEKDPRTGGGELDFDLLSDVADAFESEDPGE